MKNYTPSPNHWKDMFKQYSFYTVVEKVAISRIKINRKLFSYDNPVDLEAVKDMADNFELNAWMPITVNEDYYLLDGQHRLKCAKMLGLKYIDVVVCKEGAYYEQPCA